MALVVLLALAWPGWVAAAAANRAGEGRSLDVAVVPLVGGDTDIGLGAGALGSVARLDPDRLPFRWRLAGAAFGTVRPLGGLRFKWPYQDVFLAYSHNGLLSWRLRLELRASFTRETDLRYYGIGNASVAPADDVPERDFFSRTHPAGRARARIALTEVMSVVLGSIYTFTSLDFDPSSRLAQDRLTGSPQLRELLQVDRSHALHLLEAGILYDTRNDEIAPSRGQFHQLELRLAPWQSSRHPYRYFEVHTTLRFYRQIVSDRLVLAARAVGYLQVGDVPFHELSRYDETSALGGAKGVRGIPKNRCYGKRKTFGNLEARGRILNFRMSKSDYRLGLVGFVDGGRVWAICAAPPSSTAPAWASSTGRVPGCACKRERPSCSGSTWPGRLMLGLLAAIFWPANRL